MRPSFELEVFSALFVVTRASLVVFEWTLCGMLFCVVLKHFELFQRVPGDMHQSCIFRTSRLIYWMACMLSLALSSVDLLRVVWIGGPSSIFPPAKAGTVVF